MKPTVSRLERALPPPQRAAVRAARDAAERLGCTLWAVGGAVRDLVVERELLDVDLAVDRGAAEVARATAEQLGGVWRGEGRFLTATVHAEVRGAPVRLDIATLRTERYPRPGVLPAVRPGASIEDDLARRDFTVNTLALSLAGERRGDLVDPFGGLADLEARRLRVLHERSFRDDPTRLWRAARYAARLSLRPDADTARLIEEGVRWLPYVSGPRLWAEFERIAAEGRVLAAARLLDGWGVLAATAAGWRLLPEADAALRRRRGPHAPALLLAVLTATLDADTTGAVLERLEPPGPARESVRWARLLLAAADGEPSPATLARLEGAPREALQAAAWLDPERQADLQRALTRWRGTTAALDAAALMGLGVPRGPRLGEWLQRLRRERYIGTLATTAAARDAVRRWMREEAEDGERDEHTHGDGIDP